MIDALLKRRMWLWKNRWFSGLGTILIFPVTLMLLITFSFKNIFVNSLSNRPFDTWILTGLLYIVSSISMFPVLYREFFNLRIHRKMLVHVSLAPYSKKKIIFGYLTVATIESIVIGIVSFLIFCLFIPIKLTVIEILISIFLLIIYLYTLGNLIITVCLLSESITTIFFITIVILMIILFGNGFIIEFPFFPLVMEKILKTQPLSLQFQTLQLFINGGYFEWINIIICVLILGFWTLSNSYLFQRKLRQ